MNIEIANRLQKLRKEKGLSQEELAAQLGVSRQAVSKWERADSSPDTDNLICLAKIYGISLDELLSSEESVEDIARDKREEEKGKESVKIDSTGIHIKDEDGSTVDINLSGIHISEGIKKYRHHHEKKSILEEVLGGLFPVAVCVAYVIVGILTEIWHPTWLMFFLIPIFFSFVEMIKKRRFDHFAFPVLITGIFLFLGFEYVLWHPYWFLFLLIPPYYILAHGLDRLIHRDNLDLKVEVERADDKD